MKNQPNTQKRVGEIVEEFWYKVKQTHFGERGETDWEKVEPWLRTTLTTYGNAREEAGREEERERIFRHRFKNALTITIEMCSETDVDVTQSVLTFEQIRSSKGDFVALALEDVLQKIASKSKILNQTPLRTIRRNPRLPPISNCRPIMKDNQQDNECCESCVIDDFSTPNNGECKKPDCPCHRKDTWEEEFNRLELGRMAWCGNENHECECEVKTEEIKSFIRTHLIPRTELQEVLRETLAKEARFVKDGEKEITAVPNAAIYTLAKRFDLEV